MSELGTALCTSCGLCCAGALFTRGVLTPDEVGWARGKRVLHVIERDDGPSFTLPCALLEDRKCSVYEERPKVCQAFVCKLLERVEKGEIALEAALVKVRRLEDLFSRAKRHAASPSPDAPDALLDLGELEALAARDFRDPLHP